MPSATPLGKKLQVKPGGRLLVLDAPRDVALAWPDGVAVGTAARGRADVVLLFVRTAAALARRAPAAMAAAGEHGILWIAYPKKSSGVPTDLTRDLGWAAVERAGWGGVSQVAIDDTWSALRFRPEAAVRRKPGSSVAPGGRTAPAREAAAPAEPPPDLAAAVGADATARATWATLAPSHRREYVTWIEEAKKPETRARRVAKAVEMLRTGVRDRNAAYR